ncbi:MAG: hypothetical protein U0840_02295 [Gemmataceae bacterium]
MPEITSCPACDRKLRVPDEYVNKKVRCPGCGGMFNAVPLTVPPAPSEPPPREEEPRPSRGDRESRPERDEPTESRRGPERRRDRDEDNYEEDDPRPRGRPVRSDGFSDRRSSRSGSDRDRDLDDDRPRRRTRQDDDDEDRDAPRRVRRDDDDDRPRRSRRDDDYDDDYGPRPPRREDVRKGWRGTRMGLHLVVIAGWLQLATYAVIILGVGVLLIVGVGTAAAFLQGGGAGPGQGPNPAAASGLIGLVGGFCIFLMVVGLLGFAEFVLRLVGIGMCMQVPASRNSSARGLAIAALSCAGAAVVINIGGSFLSGMGGGLGGQGGLALAMTGTGNAFGWISNLLTLAGFICWMLCLRAICLDLRNTELAGRVVTVLISLLAYGFVAGMILVVMVFAVGLGIFTAAQGGPGGPNAARAATAATGGMIALCVVGLLLFLVHIGLYVWYILTVQQVRDHVDRQLGRL